MNERKKIEFRYMRLVLGILVLALLCSCRSTKYVQEGEYLLDKVRIQGDKGRFSHDEVMDYVRQRPNVRVLGLWRLNLGLYNLSNPKKDNGWNNWLRRIGSEPVIYDEQLQKKSKEQIALFLKSKGYFRASVVDSVKITGEKTCEVYYIINAGPLYTIGNIALNVEDDSIRALVEADTVYTLLKRGDPFDSNVQDQERERVTRDLNNNGYYKFNKDYIYYIADSTRQRLVVDDSMLVLAPLEGLHHKRYYIDTVEYTINGKSVDEGSIFRPSLLKNNCFVKSGEMYKLSDVELTNSRLRSLAIINTVSTRFTEKVDTTGADDYGKLYAKVNINTIKQQDYSVDVEGTNSSGNLGGALSLTYRHLNLFSGAETLNTRVRFALQNQFARDGKERFMTMEFGASADLSFPKLFFPYVTETFHKRRNPHTVFNLSYDYQRRPDFTKSLVTAYMRYTFHGSQYVLHTVTPVEFNVVKIPAISDNFKNYISKSYLQYSYQDHFIFSANYSFLFNQQLTKKLGTTWYVRAGLETAGNVLSALKNEMTEVKNEDGSYNTLWGIRYAQYIKTDFELRCQVTDLWMNAWVYRFFAGIGVPYGNSKMLPFEKSYFVGGANSIRAWPIRGLGPGTAKADKDVRYHNQMGDMRLEANIEYRFHIISALEGAVFVDAGNIWSLDKSTNDHDAKISKEFYKELALGGGLGIRLNFDFFIVRLDGAVKLHDPTTLDSKNGWIIADKSFSAKDINLNFAIGYPF